MLKRPVESDANALEVDAASLAGTDAEAASLRPVADDSPPEPTSDENSQPAEVPEEGMEHGDEGSIWFGYDSQALVVSLLVHVVILLALAVAPLIIESNSDSVILSATNVEPDEPLSLIDDVAVSADPEDAIGANSSQDDSIALSTAPILAELSQIPSPADYEPLPDVTFDLSNNLQQAVGVIRDQTVVKGMTGVGTTGTDGAVDQITYEILRSMEERPTLVVWFFDQSGSLHRRRQEIRDRFDRIYTELGIIQQSRRPEALTDSVLSQSNPSQQSPLEPNALAEETPNQASPAHTSSAEVAAERNSTERLADGPLATDGGAQQVDVDSISTQPPTAPLLTSVIAFGQQVHLLTEKPTADIDEIRAAIDSIEQDDSGIERVFSALYLGTERFRTYRSSRTGRGPKRNVLFIAVTDERGDDTTGLNETIEECRKYAIPVYVIGVPAPFGRDVTYVKYVDPDPRYDQSPQWARVDQGPESIMPERVKLGYEDNYFEEPVIDSGFGPYALSRLAYETGGIYFTVHPNRKMGRRVRKREVEAFASNLEYFFDPEVMEKYRPDYVSPNEYARRVQASPVRQALVQAAKFSRVGTLDSPRLRFVKRSEAGLVNDLSEAQKAAARVDPQLMRLETILRQGESHRDLESSPRWLAGFDLALGTVLAHKVRAQTYNRMLAAAKNGMQFEDPSSNTWVLVPSEEISVGSRFEKQAEEARNLLTSVAEQHAETPWGLLAERELARPIGWKWTERATDLNPPSRNQNATPNNNVPRPGVDDQKRMLPKPPPKRPIPRL